MQRRRVQGSLVAALPITYTSFPLSCANRITNVASLPVSGFYVGKVKTTLDTVTPNYWRRRRAGEFIFNEFATTERTYEILGSSDFVYRSTFNVCSGPNITGEWHEIGSAFCRQFGLYSGTPVNPVLFSGPEIGRLATEIWTGVLADRQKGSANFIESIAELEKSYAMLAAPLENVDRFLRQFRRKGRRHKHYETTVADSQDFILFVSKEWLRFRYGITPLINDVRAAMKALETGFERSPSIHKTQKVGQMAKSDFSVGTFTDTLSTVGFQISRRHSVSMRSVFYDRYQLTPFDHLGITFQNVIGVAWELTRYSFVVDWFGNIGDLIYANIPRVGVEALGGCTSIRQEWISVYSPTTVSTYSSSYTSSGGFGDSYKMRDASLTRTLGGNAGLVIRNDFRLDNWVRASDAAALVVQQLQRIGFEPFLTSKPQSN